MSSWDRVRFVPWTRVEDVSGKDYEQDKERVFRSLQREATKQIQEEKEGGNSSTFIPPELLDQKQQQLNKNATKMEFSTPDFVRSIAFGSCIGSITGAVFGFMDGMRSASESNVLKNASNTAKSKYLIQGTTRAGAMFGVFFGGFHAVKYGVRVAANEPGDVAEIAFASVTSLGAMMAKPVTRASIPYAAMLVAMDSVSIYLKEN